jgi:hypothetical protein
MEGQLQPFGERPQTGLAEPAVSLLKEPQFVNE